MTRDYGNRRPSRPKNNGPHQLLVVLVSFLIGYLTASIFDIQKVSQWLDAQVLAHKEAPKSTVKQQTAQPELPPKPKFEFYTLLANEKNHAQAPAVNKSQAKSPSTLKQTQASAASSATASAHNSVSATPTQTKPVQTTQVVEAKPANNSKDSGAYLVQVASFKARQDAEHMKGLLILKGFDVRVVGVNSSQGAWYRVVVGPYANRTLAQKAQINLAKNERLHGMVRSVKGYF